MLTTMERRGRAPRVSNEVRERVEERLAALLGGIDGSKCGVLFGLRDSDHMVTIHRRKKPAEREWGADGKPLDDPFLLLGTMSAAQEDDVIASSVSEAEAAARLITLITTGSVPAPEPMVDTNMQTAIAALVREELSRMLAEAAAAQTTTTKETQ